MATMRLTRDLEEAMLGGVLAGVAARYSWDVTLLRIVAVLVTVATAVLPAVTLYLVAWLIMPRPGGVRAATAELEGEAPEVEVTPTPEGGTGIADELPAALRDAADRIGEAATIAAEAARQAANDIGDIARRPRSVAVEEPPAAEAAGDKTEGGSSA